MEHLSPERSAWAEIDLGSLRNNFALIRHIVGPGTAIMPVVKADAYGHGAPQVARVLAEAGAAAFAVVTLEEVRQLREAGISLPVLALSYVPPRAYPALLELEGMATVYQTEQAEQLSRIAGALGRVARVHVKVDTGLTRLGFEPTEQAAEQIMTISRLPHLEINGLFSHFADSDDPDKTYSLRQLMVFNAFVAELEALGLAIPWRHISNSAAIANIPEARWNMVRPGILLHGCYASVDVPRIAGVRPVMSVKAEIVRLCELHKGGCVSYNCTWQAGRPSRIATLPLGYADGVPRLLANRGEALVAGRRAPIVGRVCMDHFMVDVTDIASETEVRLGDEAVFIGYQGHEHITADEIANMTGTINYEIFCHLGLRLPRIYTGG